MSLCKVLKPCQAKCSHFLTSLWELSMSMSSEKCPSTEAARAVLLQTPPSKVCIVVKSVDGDRAALTLWELSMSIQAKCAKCPSSSSIQEDRAGAEQVGMSIKRKTAVQQQKAAAF